VCVCVCKACALAKPILLTLLFLLGVGPVRQRQQTLQKQLPLSACLSVCLSACLSACLCMFVCMSVCMSVCLSACLSACLALCDLGAWHDALVKNRVVCSLVCVCDAIWYTRVVLARVPSDQKGTMLATSLLALTQNPQTVQTPSQTKKDDVNRSCIWLQTGTT